MSIKSTIADYLSDYSVFKIGVELDTDEVYGQGLLALGVNGKDVYKLKEGMKTHASEDYAIHCRPRMYLEWLRDNFRNVMSKNPVPEGRPAMDFVRELKQEDLQKYVKVTSEHVMLADLSHYQPLFFLRRNDQIEISWDSSAQGIYFYGRGIETVPASLFEKKVVEALERFGYAPRL